MSRPHKLSSWHDLVQPHPQIQGGRLEYQAMSGQRWEPSRLFRRTDVYRCTGPMMSDQPARHALRRIGGLPRPENIGDDETCIQLIQDRDRFVLVQSGKVAIRERDVLGRNVGTEPILVDGPARVVPELMPDTPSTKQTRRRPTSSRLLRLFAHPADHGFQELPRCRSARSPSRRVRSSW
jgi:hypothetical protein